MPAPESLEMSLALIGRAKIESGSGNFENARRALAAALLNAAELPAEFLPCFRAAFLYGALLVQTRKAPADITPEVRSEAAGLLSQSNCCDSHRLFQYLMFDLLTDLNEHRLAIPFAERSLALAEQETGASSVGDRLWKLGGCYSKLGLRDHAAIAYRASLRIFRNEAGDPRLPTVALALGNAIRKSTPAEAEALYKEAAAMWESKGQLESATPAWLNLGIVCSDQGRFDEALEYYDRVRRIRESMPGTPRAALGRLHNNLASCYRKMKRYSEAHQSADRAIAILSGSRLPPSDAPSLGFALGTKGMILRDENRDLESIEWFQRARTIFENQPTPNFENVIEELEHEATALTRLDRIAEAQTIQQKIESLRKSAAEVAAITYDGEAPRKIHEGALLVELDRGLHASDGMEILELGRRLGEVLSEQNLGEWHSHIRIPESSTLIYYGADGEAMYLALESTLRGDPRFEGARITIRQVSTTRELVLPTRMVQ